MFHQLFFILLILGSLIGASDAKRVFYDYHSEDSNERIVVRAERPMRVRTPRPIEYLPEGRRRYPRW